MNRQHAVFLAGGLALFTAIVHLLFGVLDLLDWAVNGGSVSIMPFAFVAFSLIVFLLIYTYSKGLLREAQAYASGAFIMFLPIVGYADWHAAGYTESALNLDEYGLGHEHDHDHNGDGHDHNGDNDGHDHNGDDDRSHDHNGDDDHTHGDDDHSHDHNGDDDHSHNGDDHDHNGDDHAHGDDDHSHDHDHDGGVIEVTVDHLRDDVIALTTKLAEFGAFLLFTGLALTER